MSMRMEQIKELTSFQPNHFSIVKFFTILRYIRIQYTHKFMIDIRIVETKRSAVESKFDWYYCILHTTQI